MHAQLCNTRLAMQFAEAKQLQRESAQRLNGFMDELRGGGKVDLSAKNLGEEGCAYVAEALAFNDRWVALGAPDALAHAQPRPSETQIDHSCMRPDACHGLCRCTAADFSKNGIGTLGTTQLCEVLKNNDMLQTLILGTNSIGDDGAELLAGYMASE